MQQKNAEAIRNRLFKIKDHLNIKTISGLAIFLDQKPGKLNSWIHNGNIGDTGCILSKVPYLRLEWLKTGKEPMMVVDAENLEAYQKNINRQADTKRGDIIATIERGKTYDVTSDEDDKRDYSITEMITKTAEILESKTMYKQALSSNINAFHKALRGELEMKKLSEEIENLKIETQEMKQMLISLGATLPQQKRDEIANG
jgi:hypothetical protein